MAAVAIVINLSALICVCPDIFGHGCSTWHRNSFGLIFERVIFNICFLVTSVYLLHYVNTVFDDSVPTAPVDLLSCLAPIISFSCLALLKVSAALADQD